MADGGDPPPSVDDPTEDDVVRTAADAAADVVFDAYRKSEITDLDVTVRFEDAVLEVDVYLNAPGDAQAVADEAARAARSAVDSLLE